MNGPAKFVAFAHWQGYGSNVFIPGLHEQGSFEMHVSQGFPAVFVYEGVRYEDISRIWSDPQIEVRKVLRTLHAIWRVPCQCWFGNLTADMQQWQMDPEIV